MLNHHQPRLRALGAALMLGLGVGLAHAAVQRSPAAEIQAQYEQERAVCLSGRSQQDRATCLQEAGAARNEARRGQLDESQNIDYQRNAVQRCRVFSGEEALECVARVLGAGTTSGSVGGGGILRELTTIEQGPIPPAPPRPADQP